MASLWVQLKYILSILSMMFVNCFGDAGPQWPDMFPCPADVVGMKSGFLDIEDGMRIHYVERPAQALTGVVGWKPPAPLVFVHGWPDSWRSWLRILPLLGTGQRIIALDQLGYGDSSKPKDAKHYTIPSKAHQLKAFIDGLDLGSKIQLVGHSMGSFVAWHFAAYWPNMVELLVLIGTGPRGNNGVIRQGTEYVGKLNSVSYNYTKAFQYSAFADVASAGTWFPPTTVYESLKVPIEVWKHGITGLFNVTEADGKDLFPKISARTIVVHGEKDGIFSGEAAAEVKTLLTGAASITLMNLPYAGHSVQWEEKGAFAVASLLQSHGDPVLRLFSKQEQVLGTLPATIVPSATMTWGVAAAFMAFGSLTLALMAATRRSSSWGQLAASDYVIMSERLDAPTV